MSISRIIIFQIDSRHNITLYTIPITFNNKSDILKRMRVYIILHITLLRKRILIYYKTVITIIF